MSESTSPFANRDPIDEFEARSPDIIRVTPEIKSEADDKPDDAMSEVKFSAQRALAESMSKNNQISQLQQELRELRDSVSKSGKPKSTQDEWSSQSIDSLQRIIANEFAREGTTVDENGEEVRQAPNPNVIAKAMREMADRIAEERIASSNEKNSATSAIERQRGKIRADLLDEFGEDVKDETSALRQEAEKAYRALIDMYGLEKVQSTPEFERLAILEAANRLKDTMPGDRGRVPPRRVPGYEERPGIRPPTTANSRAAAPSSELGLAANALKSGDLKTWSKNIAKQMFA